MTAKSLNDLFESARNGDNLAEKQLFTVLSERFRYLVRQRIWNTPDAEEVVQSAMLIVCREYKSLLVTASFAAWAHKVLDNRMIDYMRSDRTMKQRVERMDQRIDTISAKEISSDLKLQLVDCMKKIFSFNQQYARVINFHYQGYSVEEICNKMTIKRNTLYSLLSRGRTMLRKCLGSGKVK
jgi:RNA polymerase sigma-70 factor, ECF subfamily